MPDSEGEFESGRWGLRTERIFIIAVICFAALTPIYVTLILAFFV